MMEVNEIMRKQPFTSEARVCKLCNALILSNDDWLNHFRNGDKKHRIEYLKVIREID